MLSLLPARLGRLDLHRGRRALDGLHLPEPGLLPREEEGGALQGGGDRSVFLCGNMGVFGNHRQFIKDQS